MKKNNRFEFRLTEEDRQMLEYIMHITGDSMADILRKALKMYYNLIKHQH